MPCESVNNKPRRSPQVHIVWEGHAVDWWCLGLLMHEMLTGRHPFQGGTHYDTLRAMVTAEPLVDLGCAIPRKTYEILYTLSDATLKFQCFKNKVPVLEH